MIKVFGYELKRILKSWLFIAMLIINGIFSWYILTTDVIQGIAYTAPFSVWSFCGYIGKTLPIAMITVLLLQAGYYGKKQKQVEILTLTTPMTPAQQLLIRSAVLFVSYMILFTVTAILVAVFYTRFFNFYSFGAFIIPSVLIIIPCFVFSVGLAHLLGRLHQNLLYLFILVVFINGFDIIKNGFDFFGAGFFTTFPMTLPLNSYGEPDYIMNEIWLIARGIYLFLGIAAVAWNMKMKHRVTKA